MRNLHKFRKKIRLPITYVFLYPNMFNGFLLRLPKDFDDFSTKFSPYSVFEFWTVHYHRPNHKSSNFGMQNYSVNR